MAGGIVRNATDENRFVTVARKSSSSVSGATASAVFNLVDIYFGTEFELIEETFGVGAKVIAIDEEDILKGRTDASNTCH